VHALQSAPAIQNPAAQSTEGHQRWSARAPRVLEPRSVPPLHPPGAGRAPDRRPAAAGRVCGRLPDASAPLQVGERPVSPSCFAARRTVREETRAKAQRTSVPSCRRGPTRTVSRLLGISRGTMHASPCRTGGRQPRPRRLARAAKPCVTGRGSTRRWRTLGGLVPAAAPRGVGFGACCCCGVAAAGSRKGNGISAQNA